MEVKKSRAADLERGWTQRMLLGTMVALAVLFVGLEITITPDDPLDDPELLARLETEMELPALMQQEEEMTAAVIVEPKPATKLVVVDEMEQMKEWMRDDELMETDLDEELEELAEELREMEPPPSDEDAVSLRIAEDAPQFPGGPVAMMKWLTRNLHYPKALEPQHVQGKVVAEFIVNEDGSIAYVKVTSGLHPLCDAEVLRVLRMMPRWKPGVMDGEPCRTKVCVPVVFKN
jgi:protein TonB